MLPEMLRVKPQVKRVLICHLLKWENYFVLFGWKGYGVKIWRSFLGARRWAPLMYTTTDFKINIYRGLMWYNTVLKLFCWSVYNLKFIGIPHSELDVRLAYNCTTLRCGSRDARLKVKQISESKIYLFFWKTDGHKSFLFSGHDMELY